MIELPAASHIIPVSNNRLIAKGIRVCKKNLRAAGVGKASVEVQTLASLR